MINPWLLLALLCIFITVGSVLYFKAHLDGYNSCKSEIVLETIKAENKRENIEKKIITSNDVDLRRQFCKWVRDNKTECLQADIPISER